MSSKMEVDSGTATMVDAKSLDVHPLAIVHMSDQYTRITCGGSPMDTTTPVVGLLFGTTEESVVEEEESPNTVIKKKQLKLDIRDADDIPILPNGIVEQTKQQIELHTAVFPNDKVIGWYRVVMASSSTDQIITPSSDDLKLTRQLQHQLSSMDDVPSSQELVFALLQIPSESSSNSTATSSSTDPLPLTVYEVRDVSPTPILVELDQWSLETSEPERIAVERVVQEQPHDYLLSTQQQQDDENDDKKQSANGSEEATTKTKPSPYVTNLIPLQNSMDSMESRLDILEQYISKTLSGDIPINLQLLRQVQGIVNQLGPLQATSKMGNSLGEQQQTATNGTEDVSLVSHLAAVAKTVCAVQQYTDKFRLVNEQSGHGQGGMMSMGGQGGGGMMSVGRRYRE